MRTILLAGGLLLAALGGAAVNRWWSPPDPRPADVQRPTRPIIQIVRQQTGLPDLSDVVDRTCPSVALIVPAGAELPLTGPATAAPAVLLSDDGWLLSAASALPKGDLEAVFGNGQRTPVGEVRTDPVSGLALAKVGNPQGSSLSLSDQPPPRAGQFGLAVATPAGLGCSAAVAMVESDFVADGGAQSGYFRLQPTAADWPAGLPILAGDGRILGVIASSDQSGTALPSSTVSGIVDELMRNSLSPTTAFGFRAVEYEGSLATRLGDVRAGAGVSLVEPGSKTAKTGLRAGDIVTSADGTPVSGASELSRALDRAGATARLTVQRRDRQLTLTASRQTPAS
ncbi:S1C family serine protease [Sphingomonas sp. KRR8]|uniref:S1C family serine protease n=1 Tax=Sphingomonas sp. KRR8 TaxID=2942996 RepID=UPI00202118C3|nr:S1C family serine protease [Sphingomonas sp. KRR8]URD59810.1 S1C family serine protease [Sphingomonas sp. KRR8]